MKPGPESPLGDPGLAKTALIRELVDLSRFTDDILKTLGSGVIAVDGTGRIAYANPAAERLLGLPAARLLNRPAGEVLVTRGGGSPITDPDPADGAAGEVDLVLPDGGGITVEVRLSRRTGTEDAGGIVAILTDRTDLKRAEQDARRKERLASLGELSAGVAHEIRNPLAGIGASAQLLRSRLGDEDDRARLADLIMTEVDRLDHIVENMLQFARPPQPTLRLGALSECLDHALRLVEKEAQRNHVSVERTVPSDLPRTWIDSDQMVQVILNLVRNALQAMEDTGGEVRVSIREVSRRPYVRRRAGRRGDDPSRLPSGEVPFQDWLELEVTDTGSGMPPEALERVFNPFYTTRKRGTGLGLSITQAIVQEHGGMISLHSEEGKGTTVLVDLPRDKRQSARRQDREPARGNIT